VLVLCSRGRLRGETATVCVKPWWKMLNGSNGSPTSNSRFSSLKRGLRELSTPPCRPGMLPHRTGCPPQAFQHFEQDGPGAEPVPVEGQTPPAPCPRCGRPAEVTPLVVCFDPDFYRNASLLHEPLTRPYSTAWRL